MGKDYNSALNIPLHIYLPHLNIYGYKFYKDSIHILKSVLFYVSRCFKSSPRCPPTGSSFPPLHETNPNDASTTPLHPPAPLQSRAHVKNGFWSKHHFNGFLKFAMKGFFRYSVVIINIALFIIMFMIFYKIKMQDSYFVIHIL